MKTKEEKRIEAEMRQEDARNNINEFIKKADEFKNNCVMEAAKAELAGDTEMRDLYARQIISLSSMSNQIKRAAIDTEMMADKVNMTSLMATALDTLDQMAIQNNMKINERDLIKKSTRMKQIMKENERKNKMINKALGSANPANSVALSNDELESVKPLIEAAKMKIQPSIFAGSELNLAEQIEQEKNRVI